MRADKRRATFGVQYWQRQHPGAPVSIYLMRRKWGKVGLALAKLVRAVVPELTAAFNAMSDHLRRAAVVLAETQAARAQNFALSGPLVPPFLDDDDPEWYDGPNPWDAHTVTFGDTLERIDGTLAQNGGDT